MRIKHWAKSWTIRFNAAALAVVGMIPLVADNIGIIQGTIPDAYYKWAVLAITVANLALRARTKQPIGSGAQS